MAEAEAAQEALEQYKSYYTASEMSFHEKRPKAVAPAPVAEMMETAPAAHTVASSLYVEGAPYIDMYLPAHVDPMGAMHYDQM